MSSRAEGSRNVVENELQGLVASTRRIDAQAGDDDVARTVRDQQSKRSKTGARAEDYVDNLHDACRMANVARLVRVPTQFRVLGKAPRGELRGRFVKKATVDYVGWMLDGTARVVTVEVKHQQEGALWIGRVEPQQQAALDSCLQAGGVAVLLVVTPMRTYAVPWADARAHKTMNAEALEPYRVRVHELAYLAQYSKPAQPASAQASHNIEPARLVESWVHNAGWFAERHVRDPYNSPALGLWMAARDLAARARAEWSHGESFIEWFQQKQSTRRDD
jgi:hypothetical protein